MGSLRRGVSFFFFSLMTSAHILLFVISTACRCYQSPTTTSLAVCLAVGEKAGKKSSVGVKTERHWLSVKVAFMLLHIQVTSDVEGELSLITYTFSDSTPFPAEVHITFCLQANTNQVLKCSYSKTQVAGHGQMLNQPLVGQSAWSLCVGV